MVSEWNQIIGTIRAIGIWDFVDIAIVAVLIYQVIKLIRETRAMQLAMSAWLLTWKAQARPCCPVHCLVEGVQWMEALVLSLLVVTVTRPGWPGAASSRRQSTAAAWARVTESVP